MTAHELTSHFSFSINRILIDCRVDARYAGYVRSLFVAGDRRLVVEFEQYGFDEGGAYFDGQYGSCVEMLRFMSGYLERDVRDIPFGIEPPYPEKPSGANVPSGTEALRTDIRNGEVRLPAGAAFVLRGSDFWTEQANAIYKA